jgi:DNA-binding GntR family transcriptional regulator
VIENRADDAGVDGRRSVASASGLTGTQRAVTALRDGIRTGRYVPGQRLVEADLTRELGVGRNSLREAFGRLASEGLVLIEPHRGASIRRRTRAEIAELYDLSEVLEGLAARLAATNIALPGNSKLLASATRRLQAGARKGGATEQIDEAARFHEAILAIADNARLTELAVNLHIQTFSFQLRHAHLGGGHPIGDASLSDHLVVAEAIQRGDPQKAEAAMREHLRSGKRRVLALPDAVFD